MHRFRQIFRKEFNSFFASPAAWLFLGAFLVVTLFIFFWAEAFFARNIADVKPLFQWIPVLLIFLVGALSMRTWSEERRSGTVELLLTLPLTTWQAVMGKFLAAWLFIGTALLLTFPVWITVNYLGSPDNGVIVAGYIGSWLMAGGFLAIGACMSALTRNPVVAFILSVVVCLLFLLSGLPMVMDLFSGWAPQVLLDTVAGFSFLSHFSTISRGVIDLRDLVYFALVTGFWLVANAIVLELRKAD